MVVQETFGDWYDLLTKQDAQEANESHDRRGRRSDVEDTIDGADQYSDCEGNDIALHRRVLVVRSLVDQAAIPASLACAPSIVLA